MLHLWARNDENAPSLNLDFLSGALDSRITFTRASTATFFDSTGTLQTAAINAARFDTNPSTLAPLGLLIEEQRTNLLLQSADFGTTWGPWQLTIATNATASPDGGNNGDKFQEVAIIQEHYNRQLLTGLTANSNYTVSVFVKVAERTRFKIRVLDTDNVANGYAASYNLSTLTVFGASGLGAGTLAATNITNIGNGWYRCSVTGNAGATCTKYTVDFFTLNDAGLDNYLGVSGWGLFFWGAQCELGAFPTSYIPTTTTALTRNADFANMTGTNFSAWYNAVEGTLLAQGILVGGTSGTFPRQAALVGSNPDSDSIGVYWQAPSGNMAGNVRTAGVSELDQSALPTKTAGSAFKAAVAYKTNDANVASDGNVGTTDTTVTLPTVQSLRIGGQAVFQPTASSWLRRISYYPRRLPNSTLQALTA